ncbi:aldo/keto reductase [Virgibacillus soli]|uniref:Aldo/keto reductase n=1 Tax=Paracerasibacillus soli TaxID=480284 RepID=A0ABU5CR71_9BACI|nr:aldo/keto reductase [Virgibacillus soli]MDY0408371.1 aldo/keto reductase [Virgibacillus soli]
MHKNQLGSSDIFISELTLGCMSLGTNKTHAKNIIDVALDHGVNHLDTADLYDFGMNEEIVGEAIRNRRDQIILTTKVGNHFNRKDKSWFWDPSKTYILQAVKDSAHRLQTDYIDLVLLHGGTIADNIDDTIEAFEHLKKEGTIREYGISSIRPNVIREYVNRSSMQGVMMQYSLLDRRPEEEIFDLLHKNNVSVLARGPLAKGMLANGGEHVIDKKARDGYLDYTYDQLKVLFRALQEISTDQITINQLALAFVLQHPVVTSAVFGASTVRQVKENIIKRDIPFEQLYVKLQQLTKENKYTAHR